MRKTTITVLTTGVLLLVPAGAASATAVSPSGAASVVPSTGGDTGTTTSTSSSSDGGDKTGLWGLLGLLGLAGLAKRRDTDVRTTTREDVRR